MGKKLFTSQQTWKFVVGHNFLWKLTASFCCITSTADDNSRRFAISGKTI
jgi:hypothetical protein